MRPAPARARSSPWTGTYDPALDDGVQPPAPLRKVEVEANSIFKSYMDNYYEAGASSVYCWELDEGGFGRDGSFAACVLFKKDVDQKKKGLEAGGWDAIHVVEARPSGRSASYKLTSTVMLRLATDHSLDAKSSGELKLSGSMTRQAEQQLPIDGSPTSHIANMGRMIEDMENRMRDSLQVRARPRAAAAAAHGHAHVHARGRVRGLPLARARAHMCAPHARAPRACPYAPSHVRVLMCVRGAARSVRCACPSPGLAGRLLWEDEVDCQLALQVVGRGHGPSEGGPRLVAQDGDEQEGRSMRARARSSRGAAPVPETSRDRAEIEPGAGPRLAGRSEEKGVCEGQRP